MSMPAFCSGLPHRLPPVLLLFMTMLAAGCATLGDSAPYPFSAHLDSQDQAGACARYIAALDRAVDEAGVADRQARRIAGFPYLRVNRFLASFAEQDLSGPALTAWLDRLEALDREARQVEIDNLPAALRQELGDPVGETDLRRAVAVCGDQLRDLDLATPENIRLLRARAKVPPNYSTAKSILGLYPLPALFVRLGIARYHNSVQETYRTDLARLPVAGPLIRYLPPASESLSATEPEPLVERAATDALGIPELSATERQRLLLDFAPIWEIETSGDFDRPGAPAWTDKRLPTVDSDRPLVYTLISHTRFQGAVLLQLIYVIWFSERPLQGAFDIFGGRLDGLIWRVTLDRHGAPLLYDTIHNCGCYHMFFPGPNLAARQPEACFSEPLLAPQRPPEPAANQRLVIRVARRTHYIDRIYVEDEKTSAPTVTYAFADYDLLRSLPAGAGGRRSLFGTDGIVPGTERSERWLLWPTGVPSPGAMRQWGNHATAFFGRRHFDDPDLLEQLFKPVNPAGH
jgi:hypothetical protein